MKFSRFCKVDENIVNVFMYGEDSNCPCEVVVYNTCPTVNVNYKNC